MNKMLFPKQMQMGISIKKAGAALLLLAAAATQLHAQSLDRIVAVIDEGIITEYDVESNYRALRSEGYKDDGTLRCRVFEKLLTEKLLLAKAKNDSLTVGDDQIENELARRLDVIVATMRSEREVEAVYGKTVLELKQELRPEISDQLLVDQMRGKILGDAAVTPKEVKDFFKAVPEDSLPFFNAEVEISHIVIKPTPSLANKKKAKERLTELREQILAGKITFEEAAKKYSMDRGSAEEGGELPPFGRKQMVTEFEEEAYNMEEGHICDVFETKFGYHIIRLDQRLGDRISCRHILIRPAVDREDEARAFARLSDIRSYILSDSLTFATAAARYSDDQRTKDLGGSITADGTDRRIPMSKLDGELYLEIDGMKEGEISTPTTFIMQEGEMVKAFRIVILHKKWPPHKANLKDDYYRFQAAALSAKNDELLEEWFQKARKQIHIEIKFPECEQALENWN